MRFLMVTTFFGAESFGGEAYFVERLADALMRRGHSVHVMHDRDVFARLRGGASPRPYRPQEQLHLHTFASRLGDLSPLWTLATGGPGTKWLFLRKLLSEHAFDVVHFHNVLHLGGPRLIAKTRAATSAKLLMTAHDLAYAGARGTDGFDRLDAMIFPSEYACNAHAARGFAHNRSMCLPYFLPDDWMPGPQEGPTSTIIWRNPYFLVNGHVTRECGFHTLLPVLRRLPHCDVHVAGEGPYLAELKRLAAGMPNIKFLGVQSTYGLQRLYTNAAAVLVPTLDECAFSYTAIEAFARGRPVIARDNGALREIVEAGGGLLYATDDELETALRTVSANSRLRKQMGESGRRAARELWSEEKHVKAYLDLAQVSTPVSL